MHHSATTSDAGDCAHCALPCLLALEDGTVYRGRAFGATGSRTGEVVFNTSLTGYQEILTDPSYCGQIVTMTYPHIGNYGVNEADVESARPHVAGFIVRELTRRPSNHRATQSLHDYLAEHGIIGIEGIDTRALTKKLRVDGAMRGVISTDCSHGAHGAHQTYANDCVEIARASPSMAGADLVKEVAPKKPFTWTEGLAETSEGREVDVLSKVEGRKVEGRATLDLGPSDLPTFDVSAFPQVVAIDCGMKRNILRHLVDLGGTGTEGTTVQVVPPTATPEEVLSYKPDGVFVSNGPGDPAAVPYAVELVRGLLGKTPMFGICLGHQIIALALGGQSFKLKFGHRGANQPVLNTATGRVEITSQNHGFAIDTSSLEKSGAAVTHVNLNDKTLEGFTDADRAVLAIQYHPEASPGPHDAAYLFDCFGTMMETGKAPTPEQMARAQAMLQNRR